MRGSRTALLVCFGGAAAALLGLAWDISIHSAYPSLAQHETPLDPLSPAHDLIAAGILVAAIGAAWAIGASVSRRVGALTLLPTVASVGWIAFIALDAPVLPNGTGDKQASDDRLRAGPDKAAGSYRVTAAARRGGYI